MKNIKEFMIALSVMLGISAIESSGIHFLIALAMVIIPFVVLGIEGLKKQKAYKKALENSRNIDYLTDLVIFGEWEMN